jgi:hypothetical protein
MPIAVTVIFRHITETDWSVGPAFMGQAGTNETHIFAWLAYTTDRIILERFFNTTDETIQEDKKTE